MENPVYAPERWLGTRLACELLGAADPVGHLMHAHATTDPLYEFARLITAAVTTLDATDQEAEGLRARLADRAEHGTRYLDGPFRAAAETHAIATGLERACTARDMRAQHLTRLLQAYQHATEHTV
ncbi:hypothetical protein [Streptomyces sp. NPDC059928]|uniref:hypothetical protein n=1 Tax=unclassified Streptomyces TaxID=2593676 RepID=UPI00365702C9